MRNNSFQPLRLFCSFPSWHRIEPDRISISVTVSAPKLPNFFVSAWFLLRLWLSFRFRPGFGYGRNSKFSVGIVRPTASWNSDIEFGKHRIILQPFPNADLPDRMLSWLPAPVVLRDPARKAKVMTPLAGSRWGIMLVLSRRSLSYLIFRPSGQGIEWSVGDHIRLVALLGWVADKLSLGLSVSLFFQSVPRTTDEQQPYLPESALCSDLPISIFILSFC